MKIDAASARRTALAITAAATDADYRGGAHELAAYVIAATEPLPAAGDDPVRLAQAWLAGGDSEPFHGDTGRRIAEALVATEQRRFPVMGGPSVLWSFVAPHEAQAQKNHRQSLERLAQRGGLDPTELWCLVHGTDWGNTHVTPEAARAWLADVVRRETASAREEELRTILDRALSRWGDAVNCIELMSKELGEHEDCEDDIKADREYIAKARELVPEAKP